VWNVTDFVRFVVDIDVVVVDIVVDDDLNMVVVLLSSLQDVAEVPSNCTTDRGDCCASEDLRPTGGGGVVGLGVDVDVDVEGVTLLVSFSISIFIGVSIFVGSSPVIVFVIASIDVDALEGLEHMVLHCMLCSIIGCCLLCSLLDLLLACLLCSLLDLLLTYW
jgi:hypothetical protein